MKLKQNSLPHLIIAAIFPAILNPHFGYSSTVGLEPDFAKDKSFAQVYTITGQSGNGMFTQIQFVLTNLGRSDRNGACKIFFCSGGEKPVIWNQKFSKKQWSSSSAADSLSIKMGDNSLSVCGEVTRISAGDAAIRVEVIFESPPELIIPPESDLQEKNRFFTYRIPLRWMPARITVTRQNKQIEAERWYAMVEMSRSTTFPSDIYRGWITFRGYNEALCYNANIRFPPGEIPTADGWTWASVDRAPVRVTNVTMEIGPGTPPLLRRIAANDSSFELLVHTLMFRYSFLDELGPILGAIVKLVIGEPVVYFYRAEAKIAGGKSPIPGVIEYMRIE